MFTKYAENLKIHIMVYERLEPLQVVKQGKCRREFIEINEAVRQKKPYDTPETEVNDFVAQILAAPLT